MSGELLSIVEAARDNSALIWLSSIVFAAFSFNVREAILKRDNYRSVESGDTYPLEAAHIDHSKSNPDYDTVDNGRTLTRKEHFKDHVKRAGSNGLPKHQNDWAIKSIWKRLTDREKRELIREGYYVNDEEQLEVQIDMFAE